MLMVAAATAATRSVRTDIGATFEERIPEPDSEGDQTKSNTLLVGTNREKLSITSEYRRRSVL